MVKKAHFVTGKGGVGKSLVAAVLARALSQNSQQILLAELSEFSFYGDFLALGDVKYKPTPWTDKIDVSLWSGTEVLKEYALHLLKIKKLYELFFENPVTRSLVQVAPGLQELAVLGKATSSPRKHGPPMDYDELVIDSYATGHFLSLFEAPGAMAETVSFGPMGEQSRSIDKWIRDPAFTEVHVVTLPEDLPITETLELCEQLQERFNITPKVYLNRLLNLSKKDLASIEKEPREFLSEHIEDEEIAKKRLAQNKIDFLELPLVTSLKPAVIIDQLLPYFKDVR